MNEIFKLRTRRVKLPREDWSIAVIAGDEQNK